MSRRPPHLLQVADPPSAFAPLFAAAAERGVRIGWLELAAEAPSPLPPSLAAAAAQGALRAVATGGGRSVAVKPLRGAPVLRDLLREHFRGCLLVLVRGDVEAASLVPDGRGFRLSRQGSEHHLAITELLDRLRRPRPWD
ncbi:MAG: hypothetical protein D6696_17480 [Acidobacteria bacterium]|nr:MAG: hypothetical protein D6696_17480 [Acidobacteriota bacterium]